MLTAESGPPRPLEDPEEALHARLPAIRGREPRYGSVPRSSRNSTTVARPSSPPAARSTSRRGRRRCRPASRETPPSSALERRARTPPPLGGVSLWCGQCSQQAQSISPAAPACSRLPSSFPARGCERRHTRTRAPAHPAGVVRRPGGDEPDVDHTKTSMPFHKYRPYETVSLPDRTWPDTSSRAGADLVLDRPARR